MHVHVVFCLYMAQLPATGILVGARSSVHLMFHDSRYLAAEHALLVTAGYHMHGYSAIWFTSHVFGTLMCVGILQADSQSTRCSVCFVYTACLWMFCKF
jgi:hypothetical protein